MEITTATTQVIAANQDILFDVPVVPGSPSIIHRNGSGIVKLRGLTNQCRARFKAIFNGNIAVPTTGSAGAISVSLAIDGEAVSATKMVVTPTAGDAYFNVSASTYIDVPAGCCSILSVMNTSTQSIEATNCNLIIERVA